VARLLGKPSDSAGSTAKRVLVAAREKGASDTATEAVSRALRLATFRCCDLRRFYVVSQPLQQLLSARRTRSSALNIRRILGNDPEVQSLPRPASEIAERFQSGAECFAAIREERVAAFIWVKRGSHVEREVGVEFLPEPTDQAVWDFDLFVEPAFRTGTALSRLWDAVASYLIDQGYVWTVSVIMAENDQSLRSQRRSGSRVVAAGLTLRLGRKRFTRLDGGARPIQGLPGAAVPVVAVAAEVDRSVRYVRFRR
jgi:hypothetical protein